MHRILPILLLLAAAPLRPALAAVHSQPETAVTQIYSLDQPDGRIEFIVRADEIRRGRSVVGTTITGIGFNITQGQMVSESLPWLKVRIKHAGTGDGNMYSSFVTGAIPTYLTRTNWQPPVYHGINHLTLDTPFEWDGVSNILIDIVWNGDVAGGGQINCTGTDTELIRMARWAGDSGDSPGAELWPTGYQAMMPNVILEGLDFRFPLLAEGDVDVPGDLAVLPGEVRTLTSDLHLVQPAGSGIRNLGTLNVLGTVDEPVVFDVPGWSGFLTEGEGVTELSHVRATGSSRFVECTGGGLARLRDVEIVGASSTSIVVNEDSEIDLERVRVRDGSFNRALVLQPGSRARIVRFAADGNDANTLMVIDDPAALEIDRLTLVDNEVDTAIAVVDTEVVLRNSVIWQEGESPFVTYSNGPATGLALTYCALPQTQAQLPNVQLGAGIHNQRPSLNPSTLEPAEWTFAVDAGWPGGEPDPDGTVADIGAMYCDQRTPSFENLTDVPDDQGRRVQAVWSASSSDEARVCLDCFYSLWRMDENHGQPARGEFVHRDLDGAVRFALAHPDERVLLENPDAGRDDVPYVLTWLTNVPATRFPYYAAELPTAADGVSAIFAVVWHEADGLFSAMGFGQSEDNLAPDAVAGLSLAGAGPETLRLDWPAVETGTAPDGARLAELNGVWYEVYGSANAWFDPATEGERVGTVAEPVFFVPRPDGEQRRFFRVVAVDRLD